MGRPRTSGNQSLTSQIGEMEPGTMLEFPLDKDSAVCAATYTLNRRFPEGGRFRTSKRVNDGVVECHRGMPPAREGAPESEPEREERVRRKAAP